MFLLLNKAHFYLLRFTLSSYTEVALSVRSARIAVPFLCGYRNRVSLYGAAFLIRSRTACASGAPVPAGPPERSCRMNPSSS